MDVVVVLRVITKLQFLLACLVLELSTQYKLDWSDFFLGNFALASTAEKKNPDLLNTLVCDKND